ncbi:MAG: hypothetical protein IPP46_15390 [Bacteroidetes bacterium]|nr:hypothetical protein [Bacteroidota bacterium]
MRIKLITFLLGVALLSPKIVYCQFTNNYWVFGDSVFINWTNPVNPIIGSAAYHFRNGSSCIGDSSGLLLYAGLYDNNAATDCFIWNKYGNRIGDSIRVKGGVWYHASLFVPDPGNDSNIYLFTAGVTDDPYGFFYSNINYKANNDSGVVIQKNVILNTLPAFDALMAVRHGNGRDWWLITQRWVAPNAQTPTNEFRIFLISPAGTTLASIQNIGGTHTTNIGQLVFSSDGTKFANISGRGLVELYDFDRCTGAILSTVPIEQEPLSLPAPSFNFSGSFSVDNSKLYVVNFYSPTVSYYLYQYDLTSSNISLSKYIVDSFPANFTALGDLRLAPDGKIYLSSFDPNYSWPYPDTITAYTTINNNLSVINYPDSLGNACDFQPFSFNLGMGRSYLGLPNNPDYELGAWVGSPCDTLSVGVDDNEPQQQVFFKPGIIVSGI